MGKYIPPDNCKEWEEWKAKAEAATDRIINKYNNGEKCTPNGRIWQDPVIKNLVYSRFKSRCAYCEDEQAEIDHYRPKKKVLNSDGINVKIRSRSGEILSHPGYYWLFYDYNNFIPSCRICNSAKRCHFPLRDEDGRATNPGDEMHESPLLINPLLAEYRSSFKLDTLTFELIPDGAAAKVTKDILRLNRGTLVTRRENKYKTIRQFFSSKYGDLITSVVVLKNYDLATRMLDALEQKSQEIEDKECFFPTVQKAAAEKVDKVFQPLLKKTLEAAIELKPDGAAAKVTRGALVNRRENMYKTTKQFFSSKYAELIASVVVLKDYDRAKKMLDALEQKFQEIEDKKCSTVQKAAVEKVNRDFQRLFKTTLTVAIKDRNN